MGQKQYLRSFSCIVADASGNGVELGKLRCTFQIRRGDTQTPNSADVRIYNLSEATANLIRQKEFTQIALQAGYGGQLALIFIGNIKQARKGRIDQKDSYVDLTAGDGDEVFNFANCAFSVPASTGPVTSIQALIATMAGGPFQNAVTAGYLPPSLPANPSVRGRVFFGMTRDELREYLGSQDLQWSIQNGQFVSYPRTSYMPGEAPVISPYTGLLGVPEQTPLGLNMRVLLNPQIAIGQTIKLDSSNVNQYRYGLDAESQRLAPMLAQSVTKLNVDGLYYVMRADHWGDTRGQPWYTDLTCLAVDATVPLDSTPYTPVSGYTAGPLGASY